MKLLPLVAWIALAPLGGADHLIVRSIHTDAYKAGDREIPAKDSVQRVWVGKDRLRIEDEGRVTIVRKDLKKVWITSEAMKSVCTIELPVELARYLPPDQAQELMAKADAAEVLVTPTEESKKVEGWTARKFVLEVKTSGGVSITTDYWVTKDSGVDAREYISLVQETARLQLGGGKIATELAKIDGVAVEADRVQKSPAGEFKRHDRVTSIESKTPPEGLYEMPKGYSDVPYSPVPVDPRPRPPAPTPPKDGGKDKLPAPDDGAPASGRSGRAMT